MRVRLLSPEAEVTRSLSNLYKQWLVRSEADNARIINSNAILMERLERNNGFQPGLAGFADSDNFPADIIGESAEEAEEGPDPVELAQEEAERILMQAQEQADFLISQAQEQAAGIEEAARAQGYEEGRIRADQEFEKVRDELADTFREKNRKLDAEFKEKQDHMERELVDVILEVFGRVFHIQFDNKKEILMHLINDAILNIEGEKKFRIRVSTENAQFLLNNKEGILDRVGHNIEIEILEDGAMDGKECVIETDSGVFDCSLDVQLENLIKDIRSLSS